MEQTEPIKTRKSILSEKIQQMRNRFAALRLRNTAKLQQKYHEIKTYSIGFFNKDDSSQAAANRIKVIRTLGEDGSIHFIAPENIITIGAYNRIFTAFIFLSAQFTIIFYWISYLRLIYHSDSWRNNIFGSIFAVFIMCAGFLAVSSFLFLKCEKFLRLQRYITKEENHFRLIFIRLFLIFVTVAFATNLLIKHMGNVRKNSKIITESLNGSDLQ